MICLKKDSDLDGKMPDDAKLQRMLHEGAASEARKVLENCDKTRAQCLALVKDRPSVKGGLCQGRFSRPAAGRPAQ